MRGGEERVACEFKKRRGEKCGARVHKREKGGEKRDGFFSFFLLLPHLSPEPSQTERSSDGK